MAKKQPLTPNDLSRLQVEVSPEFENVGIIGDANLAAYPEYQSGLDVRLSKEDPTYLNRLRASNQDWTDQASNAVVGGITNGLIGIPETISSLVDPNTYKSLLGIEAAEANAVQKWANEQQALVNQSNPIFRENPQDVIDLSDPGFYWDSFKSLVESGVTYGTTGALVGGAVGLAGKGLSKINAIKNILSAEGALATQTVSAGVLNNIAEGKSIALDAYDKGIMEDQASIIEKMTSYSEELRKAMDSTPKQIRVNPETKQYETVMQGTDVTPEQWYNEQIKNTYTMLTNESKRLRGEQANRIQQLNLLNVYSDVIQAKALFGASKALRAEKKLGALGTLGKEVFSRAGVKQAVAEGAEEVMQEGFQFFTDYGVKRELGTTKERPIANLVGDFLTAPETRLSFALGAIGGPAQVAASISLKGLGGGFGTSEERRQYNEELLAKQNATNTLSQDFVRSKMQYTIDNHNKQQEAIRNGDDVELQRLRDDSFSKLFYQAANSETVNTLEASLLEVKKSETSTEDDKANADRLLASIPKLEKAFKQAQRDATFEGETNPLTAYSLYELSAKKELATAQRKNLETSLNNDYSSSVRAYNESVINEADKISSYEAELLKLNSILEALKTTKDELQTELSAREVEQENLPQGIFRHSLATAIEHLNKQIADTENAIESVQEATEVTQSKLDEKVKNAEVVTPEILEFKKKTEDLERTKALEGLHGITYNALKKPENLNQFSKEQQELLNNLVKSYTEPAVEAVKAKADVEQVIAPETVQVSEPVIEEPVEPVIPIDNTETQQTFVDSITAPEEIVSEAIKQGVAADLDDLSTNVLPEIRAKLQDGKIKPKTGVSVEEAITSIDNAIQAANRELVDAKENIDATELEATVEQEDELVDLDEQIVRELEKEGKANVKGEGEYIEGDRQLTFVNALAVSSNLNISERATPTSKANAKRLVQFLENPEVNLNSGNYSVKYRVEHDVNLMNANEDRAYAIYNEVRKGNKVSDEDINFMNKHLALRMVINRNGQPVLVNDQPIYGWVHRLDYNYAESISQQVEYFFNTTKPNIVNQLVKGNEVESKIVSQRAGYANNRYTYTTYERGKRVTKVRNTQDAEQEAEYRAKKASKSTSNLQPVINNIHNVAPNTTLAVGRENGGLIVFENGEAKGLKYESGRTKGSVYFKIKAANGQYQWVIAKTRDLTANEKALAKSDMSLEEMQDKYPTEVAFVKSLLGENITAEDVKRTFTSSGSKFKIDTVKLADTKYQEALITSEAIYTTVHPLDTGNREGMTNVFVQPTTVVSTEFVTLGKAHSNTKDTTKAEASKKKVNKQVAKLLLYKIADSDLADILLTILSSKDKGVSVNFVQSLTNVLFSEKGKNTFEDFKSAVKIIMGDSYYKLFKDLNSNADVESSPDYENAVISRLEAYFTANRLGRKLPIRFGTTREGRAAKQALNWLIDTANNIFTNIDSANTLLKLVRGQDFDANTAGDKVNTPEETTEAANQILHQEVVREITGTELSDSTVEMTSDAAKNKAEGNKDKAEAAYTSSDNRNSKGMVEANNASEEYDKITTVIAPLKPNEVTVLEQVVVALQDAGLEHQALLVLDMSNQQLFNYLTKVNKVLADKLKSEYEGTNQITDEVQESKNTVVQTVEDIYPTVEKESLRHNLLEFMKTTKSKAMDLVADNSKTMDEISKAYNKFYTTVTAWIKGEYTPVKVKGQNALANIASDFNVNKSSDLANIKNIMRFLEDTDSEAYNQLVDVAILLESYSFVGEEVIKVNDLFIDTVNGALASLGIEYAISEDEMKLYRRVESFIYSKIEEYAKANNLRTSDVLEADLYGRFADEFLQSDEAIKIESKIGAVNEYSDLFTELPKLAKSEPITITVKYKSGRDVKVTYKPDKEGWMTKSEVSNKWSNPTQTQLEALINHLSDKNKKHCD